MPPAYRRHLRRRRTLTGFHVPHARAAIGVGAPSTPGPAVFARPTKICPSAACRSSPARPCTPVLLPPSGALGNEASTGVHAVHPSGLPLARPARMGQAALRLLPWAPHPAVTRSARQGGDWPRTLTRSYTTDITSASNPASSLAPCDLVSHIFGPVDPAEYVHPFLLSWLFALV